MPIDQIDYNQDFDCWKAFIQGNRDALGILFRRHYPHLYKYGHKICSDTEILEDCIQELFIELLKAVKYKLLKALHKRNNIRLHADMPEDIHFEISYETFIIDKQEHAEKTKKVINALELLSPRQKEIIYLKFYQDLSYEEVSEIMNINYQVARNLLSQAIKAMKKILHKIPILVLI